MTDFNVYSLMPDNRIESELHALITVNFPSVCNIIVEQATIGRLLRYAGGSLEGAAMEKQHV